MNNTELIDLIEKLGLKSHSYTFSVAALDSENYVSGAYIESSDKLEKLGILSQFDENYCHNNNVRAKISYYIIGQSDNGSERLPDDFCKDIMAHLDTVTEYADLIEERNIMINFDDYDLEDEESTSG